MVERLVWDQEVAGSNPVAPTISHFGRWLFFLLLAGLANPTAQRGDWIENDARVFHCPVSTRQPSQKSIPWTRFWCPLGGVIHCGDDNGGFLTDPEDKYGSIANPTVRRLSQLLPEAGPLVLCGEPGIGKSTELENVRAVLEGERDARGEVLRWIVFRDVADVTEFRRLTVDSPQWQAWRTGTARMTLVVDGLDEGLLRVPNFVNDLTALLKDEPVSRLRLVLACRTAEWPLEMGRRLLALWPERETEPFYELCPLRRKDSELAASARGAEPDKFLQAVWKRGVMGLAARPITLFFLLGEFRDRELPATHRELYERGTKKLAAEIDPVRQELLRKMGKTGRHCSAAERLRAAQRLAALLLLTGRSAIWQTCDGFEDAPAHDLPLDAAADASDVVRAEAAQEAVESALFTSLGERRFGFVHQTFAECLAAQHLAGLPLVQLRRLLCQRDVRGEHVIPQLSELAGWTAGYHSGFCGHLLRIEPEMLLRSDVTRLQGGLKASLVTALLEGAEREEIFDGMHFGRFLDGLKHSDLAAQLMPFITDKRKNRIARRIAFSIAAKCKLHQLTDVVLAVVYDLSDDPSIRDSASATLEDIVPDERLELLEPLARSEVGKDANDTIKAHALRRLVPTRWKVRDALPFLTARRNDMFMGAYYVLLSYKLPKLIEDDDIAPCLAFIRSKTGCFDSLHSFHHFATAVLVRALALLDVPSVRSEFVSTWQVWVTRHELHYLERNSEVAAALNDTATRRKLASLYLNDPRTQPDTVYHLCWPFPILDETQDLAWLINEIPSVPQSQRRVWAAAIGQLASKPQICAPCWDLLLRQIANVPELKEQFAWLRAWELDETIARDAKARWLRDQRRRAKHEQRMREITPPDPRQGMDAAFAAYAKGNQEAWYWLWCQITHSNDGHRSHIFECDITKCPNWSLLTPEEMSSCSQIARALLFALEPRAAEFKWMNEVGLAVGAAVWLLRESLDHDAKLLDLVKRAWIPVLIWHVDTCSAPRCALFQLAYRLAPATTITELTLEAESDMQKHCRPFAFRVAADCWDSQLSDAFAGLLANTIAPKALLDGLEEFAARDSERAVKFSAGILATVSPGAALYPTGIVAAAVTALSWGAAEHWPVVLRLLDADDELARAVCEELCHRMDMERKDMLAQLSEPALADFCLLLHRLFPAASDPPSRRSGFVCASDSARQTRDSIPGILAARATEAGCHELLRLATALPDQSTGLRWTYRNAVTNVRRNLWQPPAPEAVKHVLAQPGARLLHSEDDLLELVLESLTRLQTRLTGQVLPAVEDLWRWDGSGNRRKDFRPKDEEALSDYIARWLMGEIGPAAGVVVGREVQPRRGLRTDVIIEAAQPAANGGFEKFNVVIEVKGCWHTEVRTALQTQLAEDYLRPHGLRCGIYLVGWFICARWKNVTNKLSSTDVVTARTELESLAADFAAVASDLRIEPFLLDCTF